MTTSSTSGAAEQLSALSDGQLHGAELDQALRDCAQDDAMLDRWRDYHLIGEVLRGAPPLASSDEAAFLARLRPALQSTESMPTQPQQFAPVREAANAPRWRWVAGLASLAVVAAASWTVRSHSPADELALGDTPVLANTAQGVIVRDAALQELMEAHRQQGGASVLPMPSGFLRNATFEAEPAAVSATSLR